MIRINETPNVNSLQFIVPKNWLNYIWICDSEAEAKKSALAMKLFSLNGVVHLLFGHDFVTVSKTQNIEWQSDLQSSIIELIADHISETDGLFATTKTIQHRTFDEFEMKIIKVLDEKIQPALSLHGGAIKFINYQNGILNLEFKGACDGCESAQITLKNGIENLMKFYFPEIIEVKSVN